MILIKFKPTTQVAYGDRQSISANHISPAFKHARGEIICICREYLNWAKTQWRTIHLIIFHQYSLRIQGE